MVDLAPASNLDARVAYTVGLLHAIGMVFIDRHLRCVGTPTLRFGNLAPGDVPYQELQLTGMNHARAAAFVLRAWNFSEEIVEPIEHQLQPGHAPLHRRMAGILSEARDMAAELVAKLPPPGTEPARPLAEMLGDEWRGAIAGQILVIEGSGR